MDAGVQGEEPSEDVAGTSDPARSNYRDVEEEETPEQKLERQKNALLTMISVRELKALLGEIEGRVSSTSSVKVERQPQKRLAVPRPIRQQTDRIPPISAKRRKATIKAHQQLSPQRVTTFSFDRLEIGDFKLTAPKEGCVVVPGTNWVKVDADRRIIIYQFIIARANVNTPYNVSVHVPFSSIAAVFCGFPEIIIKLNQPALQVSCYQVVGSAYQMINDLDVTEGQLASANVHKTVLRRSSSPSFQEVLLAADLALFSSVLSNGNHLSASSSLYSNYMYTNPHGYQGLGSDYGPSLHHSSYLGGAPPIPMGSSLAPHLTYSAPMMHMGAGGVQLEDRSDEGEIHLTEMQPMKIHPMKSSPINIRDKAEYRDIFGHEELMGGSGQNSGEAKNNGFVPSLQLSPMSAQSSYVSPLLNSSYTGGHMTSSNGFFDMDSPLIPQSTSSSLYALSGSPVFPPSNSPPPPSSSSSSFYPHQSLPSFSFPTPISCSSSIRPSSSYPFHSPSLMTPSPLLPMSPFPFSFSSLNTPTSANSPGFWNATMNSLRMEEFDSIRTGIMEDSIGDLENIDPIEDIDLTDIDPIGDLQHIDPIGEFEHGEEEHEKDSLELMILKDDTKDDSISPMNEEGIIEHDDGRAKFIPSQYSFSSLCNFDAH